MQGSRNDTHSAHRNLKFSCAEEYQMKRDGNAHQFYQPGCFYKSYRISTNRLIILFKEKPINKCWYLIAYEGLTAKFAQCLYQGYHALFIAFLSAVKYLTTKVAE